STPANTAPVKSTAGPLPPPTRTYAQSEGYVNPYTTFFGGAWYAKKQSRSKANAAAPVTTAISQTQITNPRTMLSPANTPDWDTVGFPLDPAGNWSLRMNQFEFGSFESVVSSSSITNQAAVTVGSTTYNLLSMTIFQDGSVSLTSDLNGN